MHITIYFNENPIYLCDQLSEELDEKRQHREVFYYDDASGEDIKSLISEMVKPGFRAGILLKKDLEALKEAFFSNFEYIEAAGGIVQNEKKDILLIFRKGKWDLPKGKIDKGEDAETCASREITEETGVTGLTHKYKIGSTFHIYEEDQKKILKESHWFFYTTSFSGKLVPQEDEDITKVTWTPTRNIKEPMMNSYATIRSIMHSFFDKP